MSHHLIWQKVLNPMLNYFLSLEVRFNLFPSVPSHTLTVKQSSVVLIVHPLPLCPQKHAHTVFMLSTYIFTYVALVLGACGINPPPNLTVLPSTYTHKHASRGHVNTRRCKINGFTRNKRAVIAAVGIFF